MRVGYNCFWHTSQQKFLFCLAFCWWNITTKNTRAVFGTSTNLTKRLRHRQKGGKGVEWCLRILRIRSYDGKWKIAVGVKWTRKPRVWKEKRLIAASSGRWYSVSEVMLELAFPRLSDPALREFVFFHSCVCKSSARLAKRFLVNLCSLPLVFVWMYSVTRRSLQFHLWFLHKRLKFPWVPCCIGICLATFALCDIGSDLCGGWNSTSATSRLAFFHV